MHNHRLVPLTRPFLDGAEVAAVAAVLASGHVVQGRCVQEFERLVAESAGTRHAIAVTSATTGLELALAALGIGSGDEVLVPAFTFPATANVVTRVGASPVLVDVRRDDYAIDLDHAEAQVGTRTRAIIPVDPFGLPHDATALAKFAARYGLAIVEDAACALGARCDGRPAGSLGDIGVFSFHGRKTITTGEGGVMVTDDADLAAKMERLRNHGIDRTDGRIAFVEPAGNHRMSDIAAAIGVVQMHKLERIIDLRRSWAARLSDVLSSVAAVTPQAQPSGRRHTYQSYVVCLDEGIDRGAVIAAMRERGVETTIGTYALHREPVFRDPEFSDQALPGASVLGDRCLTLPLFPTMEDEDVRQVHASLVAALTVGARE